MLAFVLEALKLLPSLIAAGSDVAGFIAGANAAVKRMLAENRGPDEAEWAALHGAIDTLMGELG